MMYCDRLASDPGCITALCLVFLGPKELKTFICVCLCVAQDFDMNSDLKAGVTTLLEEVLRDPDLLSQERKATTNILRLYQTSYYSHYL